MIRLVPAALVMADVNANAHTPADLVIDPLATVATVVHELSPLVWTTADSVSAVTSLSHVMLTDSVESMVTDTDSVAGWLELVTRLSISALVNSSKLV